MRLWILSDLHRDMGVPWTPEAIPEADVAVVAGDVGEGIETSLDWLARTIRPHMRVVFVAGNHEYYRSCRPDALAAGRIAAARSGVDFLEDEATWIGDVAFAGCTLWTDYRLDGDGRVDLVLTALGANGVGIYLLLGQPTATLTTLEVTPAGLVCVDRVEGLSKERLEELLGLPLA